MTLANLLPLAALALLARPVPLDDAAVIKAQRPSYPFKACVISGRVLADPVEPVEFVIDERLVRLCCDKCVEKVRADKAAILKKIDAAVVAEQRPRYPLTVSAVSDAKLDDKAVDYVHGTRLVRLANAAEVETFKKDPAPVMKRIDKALIEAQLETYPLENCIVTDEPMGGEMGDPIDHLYGTQLVRFCCKACIRMFNKNPDVYLVKLAKK